MPRRITEVANPFPGLRPFRADEDFLFFGRENQVNMMVDKLARTRLLAVVGSSGSGKSSLVNCGLRPALHRGLMATAGTSWHVAQFRPGGNPIRALARALAHDGVLFSGFDAPDVSLADMVEATLRMSKLGLVDIFEQAPLPPATNLLVVADQFEELFRYRQVGEVGDQSQHARSQEVIAFVNLLLEAAEQRDRPIYVVLTMRSDFLGDCALIPRLPEAINEGQYLVPRMTRDELRSAIVGPVRVGDGEIAPILLTRLVNDVGDNPDQLSILQHALNRTWARWANEDARNGPLDLPQYDFIGTMTAALDRHAEKAFGELANDRERRICEVIFEALTDRGTDARGIRRPTTVKTLCELTKASAAELTKVVDVFRKPSRSFLMPPLPEVLEPDTVVDISHESLMRVWKRLIRWTEEEAESAARFRRLAESAVLYSQGKVMEMTDPELSLMLKWWEVTRPTAAWAERYAPGFELAAAYLEKSRAKRDAAAHEAAERDRMQSQRATVRRVIVAGTVLVAILVGNEILSTKRQQKELAQAFWTTDSLRVVAETTAAAAMTTIAALSRATSLQGLAEGAYASARTASSEALSSKYAQTGDSVRREADRTVREATSSLARLAVISAGGSLLTSGTASATDLFDVRRGARVTGTSGAVHASGMLGDVKADPDPDASVTFFKDGEPEMTVHWITWRLPQMATVRSVALYAKHDAPIDGYELRRAMASFALFVRAGSAWNEIKAYQPALPYGNGPDQTWLAVCLPVPSVRGDEFKAEFVQAVDILGQWSAPRVIALDGFADAKCGRTGGEAGESTK